MGSINQNFFNPRTWERDGYKIKTLRLKDCIGANNRPFTHLLFNEMNETGLNFMEYMRFSSVIANSLKKFSTNIFQEGACISQVITKVKKGSSVYRKYITAATLPKADMKTATNRYICLGRVGTSMFVQRQKKSYAIHGIRIFCLTTLETFHLNLSTIY